MNSGIIFAGFTALLGLALAAVLVSQKAQTASVIQAIGSATAGAIGAATAPVTNGGSAFGG